VDKQEADYLQIVQMVTVSFPVGPKEDYQSSMLELNASTHQIEVTFEEGEHVFTSSDFRLGSVRVAGIRDLIGRLVFQYSYDPASKVITVCATDYPSANGMTLMTIPQGMEQETCFEHAADCGFLADEVYRNGKWNYSPLMPGAPARIKSIARDASDALIAALGKIPDHIVRLRKILPDLSAEDFKALSFVIVDGKVVGGLDRLDQLGADAEIVTPFSTFNGIEQWGYAWDFANVVGSTHDPLPVGSTSWIALWKAAVGNPFPTCTSTGFPGHVICSPSAPVGGHIVPGTLARPVAQGSDEVRIFPICHAHNGTNASYMRTLQQAWCVRLDNYFL